MRVVNKEEFIRLPAGTVFAEWIPDCIDGDIKIKTDSGYENDGNYFYNGECTLAPIPVNDDFDHLYNTEVESEVVIYDGDQNCYEKDQLFLIFSKEDIDLMIKMLNWAKLGCPVNEEYPYV